MRNQKKRSMQCPTTLYVCKPRHAARWGEATLLFFKRFTVFSGRATRSEFWWWMFTNSVVVFLLSLSQSSIMAWCGLLWTVITFVPTLAIGARRLNDSGLRRIWCILPYVGSLSSLLLGALFALQGVEVIYTPAAFPSFGNVFIGTNLPIAGWVGLLTIASLSAYVVLMLRQSRSSLPNAKVSGPSLNVPKDLDSVAKLVL